MDYSTEKYALIKYQWDYIHNPQSIWFAWLEKEEEGAYDSDPLHNCFILVIIDNTNGKLYYCSDKDITLPEVLVNKLKDSYKDLFGELEITKSCTIPRLTRAYIQYKRIYKNKDGYLLAKTTDYQFKWVVDGNEIEINTSQVFEIKKEYTNLVLKYKLTSSDNYNNNISITFENIAEEKKEQLEEKNKEESISQPLSGIINTEAIGTLNWQYIEHAKQVVSITNASMYQDILNSGYTVEISVGEFPEDETIKGECKASINASTLIRITDIIKDKWGNNKDCKIEGHLTGEEQEIIRDALWERSKEKLNTIRGKLYSGDIIKIEKIIDKRKDPQGLTKDENSEDFNRLLLELDIPSMKRQYTDEEAKNYISVDKVIYIKLSLSKLKESYTHEQDFAIKLAHELGHAWFCIFRTVEAWKWQPGKLGVEKPPRGAGHDENNPNGKYAVEMQMRCEREYNNALKMIKK